MTEPLKLKNPGESVTIVVKSCTKVPVGRYPEWEFVGQDGTTVRMPESAFNRQLKRLELDAELILGMTVTIGRSENKSDPSKPYWDLDVSGAKAVTKGGAPNGAGPESATTATSVRSHNQTQGTAPAAPPEKEKASVLYDRVTDHVLTAVVPRYQKAGIEVTDRGVAAIVATLFIAANNGKH